MGVKLMQSRAELAFHIDGGHEIDASLLADIIKQMAELTKITATFQNPEAYLKMNVTTFRNGSFEINFSAICEVAATLFIHSKEAAEFASTTIKTLKEYFEVKKLLKGQKPAKVTEKSPNEICIEAQDGNTICVSKSGSAVINNFNIDRLTVNIAQNVKDHNPDGGFSLADSSGNVAFSSEDIESIAHPFPIEDTTTITFQKQIIKTALPIAKADLLGHSRWGFRYKGKNIEASILDSEFIQRVHNGEIIKAGDSIDVTLEIDTALDTDGKPIENSKKYTITKVHGNINHDVQQLKLQL